MRDISYIFYRRKLFELLLIVILLLILNHYTISISDYAYFGRDSDKYTYVSDAHGTTSWLDHFICSHDLHSNIVEMKILEKNPCSDHLPIYMLSLLWTSVQRLLILVLN